MSREPYESRWKDYYQVLGIEPKASLRTIRQAWQRLSQDYHPDVAGNSKANLARIKKLNAAYEVLSDRDRRAKYDQAYQARKTKSPETSPARPVRRRTPQSQSQSQSQSPPPPAYTPTPMPMPPKSQQPQPEEPTPVPSERWWSPASRTRLVAAAGAIGMLALIAVGAMPGLLASRNGPAAPQPSSFSPAAPTPLPALEPTPTSSPSETTPQPDPSPDPTGTLPPQSTLAPTSTTPVLRDSIPVMSPDARDLGFLDFQVSGTAWLVDFSSQCQEAPCLRSGSIPGAGISSLWFRPRDLPASARTVSFDIKAATPGCCASFRMVGGPRAGAAMALPNGTSWTRFETALLSDRPVVFEWQFFSGASGVSPADGIWIDNIQFK